jgi:Cellulase M and related proteins
METEKLLLELSGLNGTSGRENAVADYLGGLLAPYGKVRRTPLGSVVCTLHQPQEGKAHILLEAHMDEIGMVVTCIEESGFLRVAPIGGMDRRVLLASRVQVHTRGGPLNGVICSVPPHLNTDGDKQNKKVEDLYIDIGCDKETAQKKVLPGDRVTLHAYPRKILGNCVSGKALDNRAGCVAVLLALDTLSKADLDCGLTVLFSSMEEVGGQGAKTAAYAIAPTHALAVDVSFGAAPDVPKEKSGKLGEGPMIGFAPILSDELSRMLVEVAERESIPYQYEAMGGRTGTNADQIATSGAGVKTALVSVPQKFMHMPIEVVDQSDVEYTGRLLVAISKELGGARE